MYRHNSRLAKDVCEKVGFRFEISPLEAMERAGKIFVKGTALKPDEARALQAGCERNGYTYKGPWA